MEAESGILASELLGNGGHHLPVDLVGRGRPGQPGCYLGQDSGLPARDADGMAILIFVPGRMHRGTTPQSARRSPEFVTGVAHPPVHVFYPETDTATTAPPGLGHAKTKKGQMTQTRG